MYECVSVQELRMCMYVQLELTKSLSENIDL